MPWEDDALMAGSAAPDRGASYFDRWYADLSTSPARDALVSRTLGLPPELHSTSSLSWQGLAEVTAELRLPRGALLLDLACGRGGYGIEIARRSGVRLLGIDVSHVALDQARAGSARLLPGDVSSFQLGTLVDTGLPSGSVQGVVCVDSVQFAEPPVAALREARRVLAPSGRLVVTCWEPTDRTDERVSARLRSVDLQRDLPAAGFVDVVVQDRPLWRAAERTMWEAAVAVPVGDDPAMTSFQDEGRRSLAAWGRLRRVLATATAP